MECSVALDETPWPGLKSLRSIPGAFAPSVDVVILSWDRTPDTIDAIHSVLRQRDVEPHIYVIDQGTSLPNLEKLKRECALHSNVTLVCNERNNGVPGGRNQGTALGSASYVVSLDNDAVFLDENQISNAISVMEMDKTIAVVAFRIILFENGMDDFSSWLYHKNIDEWARRPFEALAFVGAGHMIRRSFFETVKGYDDKLFFLHEEIDLSQRIINIGGKILYAPQCVVRHKVSPERRVDWNSRRYYRNIRNSLYIAFKSCTLGQIIYRLCYYTLRGFAEHHGLETLRALCWVLSMLPSALWQRWTRLDVKLTPEAWQKIREVGSERRMSSGERIARRFWTLVHLLYQPGNH